MREKSVSHTRIQDFFLGGGGGGGGGCLKRHLTIFLVLNFNIVHFTVIERRSRIRACPHSSERLILGGGVLIYFYTFFFGGGGGCLKRNLTIFLVLNFNIVHFTVIERRSRIRACPHSSERLILGGGVLIYFYTYEKSHSPLCQKWECHHTKEFSLLQK